MPLHSAGLFRLCDLPVPASYQRRCWLSACRQAPAWESPAPMVSVTFYCTRGMGDQRMPSQARLPPAAQRMITFSAPCAQRAMAAFWGSFCGSWPAPLVHSDAGSDAGASAVRSALECDRAAALAQASGAIACAGKSDQAFILCFFQIDAA